MQTAFIAYIPVLHAGYLELLSKLKVPYVYVLSRQVLDSLPEEFEYVGRKDSLRALAGRAIVTALSALFPESYIHCAELSDFEVIRATFGRVIMPDEDISHYLAEKYFSGMSIEYHSVFLRWDRQEVMKQETASAIAGVTVTTTELDRLFMREAEEAAHKSADWWRQVGAVLVKDGKVLYTACNQHTPHPQTPYAFGDPRSLFKRGVRIECSTAEHGEGALIAEAASHGISTKGADLYVKMFPCPFCARLVAHAGIRRCLFSEGYAVLDGADEMRRHGVALVHVQAEGPRE